jgi:hypothetical protein
MPAEGSLYATNHPPRRRIFLIMARLVICANGAVPVLKFARQLIRTGDVLYAADGGTRHALALGLMPSVVVGDLDSLNWLWTWPLKSGTVKFSLLVRWEAVSTRPSATWLC